MNASPPLLAALLLALTPALSLAQDADEGQAEAPAPGNPSLGHFRTMQPRASALGARHSALKPAQFSQGADLFHAGPTQAFSPAAPPPRIEPPKAAAGAKDAVHGHARSRQGGHRVAPGAARQSPTTVGANSNFEFVDPSAAPNGQTTSDAMAAYEKAAANYQRAAGVNAGGAGAGGGGGGGAARGAMKAASDGGGGGGGGGPLIPRGLLPINPQLPPGLEPRGGGGDGDAKGDGGSVALIPGQAPPVSPPVNPNMAPPPPGAPNPPPNADGSAGGLKPGSTFSERAQPSNVTNCPPGSHMGGNGQCVNDSVASGNSSTGHDDPQKLVGRGNSTPLDAANARINPDNSGQRVQARMRGTSFSTQTNFGSQLGNTQGLSH